MGLTARMFLGALTVLVAVGFAALPPATARADGAAAQQETSPAPSKKKDGETKSKTQSRTPTGKDKEGLAPSADERSGGRGGRDPWSVGRGRGAARSPAKRQPTATEREPVVQLRMRRADPLSPAER